MGKKNRNNSSASYYKSLAMLFCVMHVQQYIIYFYCNRIRLTAGDKVLHHTFCLFFSALKTAQKSSYIIVMLSCV